MRRFLLWLKNVLRGTTAEPSIGVTIRLPTFHKEKKMSADRELTLKRHTYTDKSTIGDFIDTDRVTLLCYTLEDTIRRKKFYGLTAIPSGRYQIVMKEFRDTGKLYPHLLNVPFYTGIFIHGGNFPEDSLGCPLVGMRTGPDRLFDSQKALNERVIPRINQLLKEGDVYLVVQGGYPSEEWEAHNV